MDGGRAARDETVAVALFEDEIAPRLDCCNALLVATDTRQQRRTLTCSEAPGRLAEICRLKPDVLLCGGVRRCDFFLLVESGIAVFPGLTGRAGDRLADYRQGNLGEPLTQHFIPGGRGCRRGRRRNRGG